MEGAEAVSVADGVERTAERVREDEGGVEARGGFEGRAGTAAGAGEEETMSTTLVV